MKEMRNCYSSGINYLFFAISIALLSSCSSLNSTHNIAANVHAYDYTYAEQNLQEKSHSEEQHDYSHYEEMDVGDNLLSDFNDNNELKAVEPEVVTQEIAEKGQEGFKNSAKDTLKPKERSNLPDILMYNTGEKQKVIIESINDTTVIFRDWKAVTNAGSQTVSLSSLKSIFLFNGQKLLLPQRKTSDLLKEKKTERSAVVNKRIDSMVTGAIIFDVISFLIIIGAFYSLTPIFLVGSFLLALIGLIASIKALIDMRKLHNRYRKRRLAKVFLIISIALMGSSIILGLIILFIQAFNQMTFNIMI